LIGKLGWGEPNPPLFSGATINSEEWIAVLAAGRRRVFIFLLWTPLSETLARKMGRMGLAYAARMHGKYDHVTACSSEYTGWSRARMVRFPNLRYSTTAISVRLSETLLTELKMLTNERDVPYQSLLKVYLVDRVAAERRRKRQRREA
jgi:CopG antitoxin of type II toxin-antitoxin system